MGHGSYTSSDWAKLQSSRNIKADSKVSDLYQSRGMKAIYDPSRIKVRESRDSKDNPLSTAIIVGLDVTGSMGYLSEEIAKNSLNKTMLEIYDKQPVTNPHIMFQAIGDSKSDRAPLQATQCGQNRRLVSADSSPDIGERARNDRKVRLEVAKTLEGAIPDLAAKQIIDDAITPAFRQQQFRWAQGSFQVFGKLWAALALAPTNPLRKLLGFLLKLS